MSYNILVTGGLGHIGSALIHNLPVSLTGSEIYILDNLSTGRYPSLFNLDKRYNFHFFDHDVRLPYTSLINSDIDYVVNLAALTEPALSKKKPKYFIEYNKKCTQNAIDFCISTNSQLITISSTSIYNKSGNQLTEKDAKTSKIGQTPYSTCKIEEELLINNSVKLLGLNATILRFGTIYGPSIGMRFHTAVNKFCWEAALNRPLSVWETALYQNRPYLDVKDATRAITHCIEKSELFNETYNIVTTNCCVNDIINVIKSIKPDLSVNHIKSDIMNDLSYTLNTKKFQDTDFKFEGSLKLSVEKTLQLLQNL